MIHSAITGKYETRGEVMRADCVIGHSFGTSIDARSPNAELASLAADWAEAAEVPLMMDETLTTALPVGAQRPVLSVGGPISNTLGSGVGTWGTFLESKHFMDEYNLRRPLLVAQAFHIGRVMVQAIRLGMEPIVVGGMPTIFDPKSEQPWTRSQAFWIPREVVGLAVLKAQKRL